MTDGYKIKRILVWQNGEEKQVYPAAGRLPQDYQEVEWIQSSGSQYIDTRYIPTIYDTIETKFQTQASTRDTNLYGSRYWIGGGNYNDFSIWINTSSGKGIAVHYPTGGGDGQTTDTSWFFTSDIINTPRILKVTPKYCYVDNDIKYTFNVSRDAYTGSKNAFIFGQNDNQGYKLGKFKIYYFNISSNGTSQREFVPCYRKSDSVIGMYDLVNNQFYTNSGSGTFTKGPDVS